MKLQLSYLSELGIQSWLDRATPIPVRVSPKRCVETEFASSTRNDLLGVLASAVRESVPVVASTNSANALNRPRKRPSFVSFRIAAWVLGSCRVVVDVAEHLSLELQERFSRDILLAIAGGEGVLQELQLAWPPFAALQLEQDLSLIFDDLNEVYGSGTLNRVLIGPLATSLFEEYLEALDAPLLRDPLRLADIVGDPVKKADLWRRLLQPERQGDRALVLM